MAGWTRHEGLAVALPVENVDTDQLIPARFMSAPRSAGYGGFLLHDLRRTEGGALRDDIALNRVPGASVLVARRNFGSGSSREAAVYALVDAGFRAVIAPSFGDIFASNAVNNGLLPARMEAEAVEALIAALGAVGGPAVIDLDALTASVAGQTHPFALDPVWRVKLVQGWDDIDLTAARADQIAAYRAERLRAAPWAFPQERPHQPRTAG